MKQVVLGLAVAGALSGCAGMFGDAPQTADAFREYVAGGRSSFAKVETFEVKRPVQEIAVTWQRRAAECLQAKVYFATVGGPGPSGEQIYRPTVINNPKRAELHVQMEMKAKGVVMAYNPPKDGFYVLVMDATPIDKGRTRIDMYRSTFGYDAMQRAVRGWTTGETNACPDLTR